MKETSPKSNNGTILDINESFKIEFDPISDALAAIRNGECIIVVDDERRENEGDLICAAQFATPQQINFMATEGRGLICLAMQGEKLDSLDLPLMVDRNTDENQTAFTISIDADSLLSFVFFLNAHPKIEIVGLFLMSSNLLIILKEKRLFWKSLILRTFSQ